MKRLTQKYWIVLLLFIALLLPATAYAQGPGPNDKIIFGGSFTLKSGETLNGDIVVFGGTADIESGSTVIGDVAVIGGSVGLDGTVRGDVVVVGGALRLGATAVVQGDAINFGGSLDRHPDAKVSGDTVRGFRFEDGREGGEIVIPGIPINPGEIPELPGITIEPPQPKTFGDRLLDAFLRGVSAIAWAAILAVLGVLVVVFLPKHSERVAATAVKNPWLAMLAGALSQIFGIILIAILAITVCLLPFALVLLLALIAGWFFGWLALGWIIGKRLLAALKIKRPTPILEAAVGVVILTLIWRLPLVVPFIGGLVFWVIGLFVGWIGLGAVLLTRFGTDPYGSDSVDDTLAPAPLSPPALLSLPDPVDEPHFDANQFFENLDLESTDEIIEPDFDRSVMEVRGIGATLAQRLSEAGITTLAQLAVADAPALAAQIALSETRVQTFIEEAQQLLLEI